MNIQRLTELAQQFEQVGVGGLFTAEQQRELCALALQAAALLEHHSGEWETAPDGLLPKNDGVLIRIMQDGKCIWTKDTLFDQEDKVFLPDDMRVFRRIAKEPTQP